ncbi:MAG: tetratricopeptide repeat protein [Blastocatellia bacterium]
MRFAVHGACICPCANGKRRRGTRDRCPASGPFAPLRLPDRGNLEPDVRAHLAAFENELAALTGAASDTQIARAYGLLGQVYQAYSLPGAAEICYANARALAPRDFRWVYLAAWVCQQDSRAAEAIALYQQARALRPDYLALPVHLGNLYLRQNRIDEARASFTQALALNDRCTAARYGLGQAALSARDYTAAARDLAQALAEAPDATRIHYALAMALRGLGKLDQARAHLEQQGPVGVRVTDPLVDELTELPRGERIHMLRGRMAFDAGRYAEAATAFAAAVAASPRGVEARINLGSTLGQLRRDNEAAAQLDEALRLAPGAVAAHYNLALIRIRQNQPAHAITHLRAVLLANPDDTEARLLLARQLVANRQSEEAAPEYARVVTRNPDNEDALLELTQLLLQGKQHQQALAALEKGHALHPQKGRTMALLAWMLAAGPAPALRDGTRALPLARAVYQATGLASHGALIAMALAEQGKCAEALAWQNELIAAARRAGQAETEAKLKTELSRYEQAPCRAP